MKRENVILVIDYDEINKKQNSFNWSDYNYNKNIDILNKKVEEIKNKHQEFEWTNTIDLYISTKSKIFKGLFDNFTEKETLELFLEIEKSKVIDLIKKRGIYLANLYYSGRTSTTYDASRSINIQDILVMDTEHLIFRIELDKDPENWLCYRTEENFEYRHNINEIETNYDGALLISDIGYVGRNLQNFRSNKDLINCLETLQTNIGPFISEDGNFLNLGEVYNLLIRNDKEFRLIPRTIIRR